jgi:hypothetical protein
VLGPPVLALPSRSTNSTNRRGSDVDSPIRHANPDQRTHAQVPHRQVIHQPPLAAALQSPACERRSYRWRPEAAAQQRQAALFYIRRCEFPAVRMERCCRVLPADRRPPPAWQELNALAARRIVLRMYMVPSLVLSCSSSGVTMPTSLVGFMNAPLVPESSIEIVLAKKLRN